MTYMKISINLLDSNPFQTREKYDDETVASIAVSAMGRHGLLQAPMVRPFNDRYQIAFGHGRVKAVKALGKKKVECRVEEITDEEMKKYVLQENVLRSDLSEEERMIALEQYKTELIEKLGREPTYVELSQATGISEDMLSRHYFVKEVRIRLKNKTSSGVSQKLILRTRGLDSNIQDKLILKTLDMGWSSDTAFKVKKTLKEMNEEVVEIILKDKSKIPHKVISKLAELDTKKQIKVLGHIEYFRLNEKDSLNYIEKVKLGLLIREKPEITVNYFEKIERTFYRIRGWGIPMILAMGREEWNKAIPYVKAINEWTNFLLKIQSDTDLKATPPKPPKLNIEVDEKKIIEAEYTIVTEES